MFREAETACFHEAGHAVVGLFLGCGVSRVAVSIECRPMENGDGLGYGFGGRYDGAKRAFGRMNRQIKAGGYGWAPLVSAVVSCAGPAAELRFRREVGSPARLLWATIGDHESVDGIGKLLEDRHGRDRFAFRLGVAHCLEADAPAGGVERRVGTRVHPP